MPDSGQTISHYRIIEKLGQGGMGVVFLAHDTSLDRKVALKFLPDIFSGDPEQLARFEREAKALAKLAHPNILTIFDFGREGDTTYAVTELLEGKTLREQLVEGALPWRKAVEIAAAMAEGLASAHNLGIVHRDVKPSNVFLTTDGRTKILDFGLARNVAAPLQEAETCTSLETDTTPGTVLGTVGYMSPEQVRGQTADHRSDIFSLGCVLYEMLSGKRAFERPSVVETLHAVLKAEPPEISAPEAPIAPMMERLVRRCLEKESASRFQSTSDLAFALRNLLDTSGSGLHAAVSKPQAAHRRRARRVAMLAGSLILAFLFGAGIVAWLSPKPAPAPPMIHPLTFSGKDYSPSVSPDGRTIAFVSERDGRQRIWMKQIETGAENPVTDGPDIFPRISPDGNWILFTRAESEGTGSLYKVAHIGGNPQLVRRNARYGDWAPDGKKIAYLRLDREHGSNVILVADPNGSDDRQIALLRDPIIWGLRWSPDGRTLTGLGNSLSSVFELLIDVETGRWQRFNMLPEPDPRYLFGWPRAMKLSGPSRDRSRKPVPAQHNLSLVPSKIKRSAQSSAPRG